MVLGGSPENPSPLIPAATVLLLRDTSNGLEVLLLRRNKALKAFGGAWVFPGGRVDDVDGPGLKEIEKARQTAIRETMEETSLDISDSDFVTLSNWIPPVEEKRRFSTWFFVTNAPDKPVIIDDGEIHDYQWISPRDALAKVPNPELMMMPPTYVSLWCLKDYNTVKQALGSLSKFKPEIFETKFARSDNGFVTLWPGDSSYECLDLTKTGPRRRLYANPKNWQYETDFR